MKSDLKKKLKAEAMQLKPVVMTGNKGLTAAVHQEIEVALLAHELIKIRLNAADRTERQAMIESIIAEHQAELIQQIGHILVIYRKNPES